MHSNQKKWEQRANLVLGGGPATYSKHPSRFPASAPSVLVSGQGAWVTDTDGHDYLDTIAGLGATLIGYGHTKESSPRLAFEIEHGGSFSLTSKVEVEAAEMLAERYQVEAVRFGKNGADALQAAVRLARYSTGHDHILCSGYHGMHDWYITSTKSRGGVLAVTCGYTTPFHFLDIDDLMDHVDMYQGKVAGVVIEVPPLAPNVTDDQIRRYLHAVQNLCRDEGILFIVDEIVTSPRYWKSSGHSPALGLTNRYAISPDVLCVGKGIANGFPLSAVCGKADLLSHFRADGVFFSSTFGGETYSLAAMMDTLEQLTKDNLMHLQQMGSDYLYHLQQTLDLFDLPATVLGDYARMTIQWHGPEADKLKTAWIAQHLEHGILYGVPIFPMLCWNFDDLIYLKDNVGIVARQLGEALKQGSLMELIPQHQLVTDVFRRFD
jgi:glutamate-1-semialdehyde 2,1-aminomutase